MRRPCLVGLLLVSLSALGAKTPQAQTRPRILTPARPARVARATSEDDGILIDFDDEDD